MRDLAIRIHRTGGPDTLAADEITVPPPGPGEAQIQQASVGVNFIDVYHRAGVYPLALPTGIGSEAAGTVAAVGPGVTTVAAGDRVAYAGGAPGAYATRRNVPAERLVKVPAGIGLDIAAAAMLKGMTVEYLIHRTFPVTPGMCVLWHAAAGGVGLIAGQWLKHLGATAIGTVGGEAKAALARAHGYAHVIDYSREDFPTRVREITGGAGVPVVFDAVGKTTFDGSLRSLARRGTLVSFGNASGKPEAFDPLVLSQRGSLYLTRPTLGDYTATRAELEASAAALFDVITKGAVQIEISARYPLGEAARAHADLEARKTTGSLLLVP
jgi:NADPH2:quinone reductase